MRDLASDRRGGTVAEDALLKQPWNKAEGILSATLVARCGGARYHLIAERLPTNNGWDWTVWRQGDEPEA